jgi:hypothetical protein
MTDWIRENSLALGVTAVVVASAGVVALHIALRSRRLLREAKGRDGRKDAP